MSENILKKIIDNKKIKINKLKKEISFNFLSEKINENKKFIEFKKKIVQNHNKDKISIIAEIKKDSQSAGIIIKDYKKYGYSLIRNVLTKNQIKTIQEAIIDRVNLDFDKNFTLNEFNKKNFHNFVLKKKRF